MMHSHSKVCLTHPSQSASQVTDLVCDTEGEKHRNAVSPFIVVHCRTVECGVTNEDLYYNMKTAKYPTLDGSAMNQQLLCFCLNVQMGDVLRPLFLIFTTSVELAYNEAWT